MGKRLFILAALLVLALPALLAPFGADIRSYRADAAVSPADRLAMRTAAITARAKVLELLGESGSSQVIAGKDGFLFFEETLADFQGTRPWTQQETAALTDKLAALRDELSGEGRELIVLIAPNKNTIYPEMMPDHMLPAREDGLERINAALVNGGLHVLDAGKLLKEHKTEGLLYYRGDTHWNARGAEIVYRELMRMTGTAVPTQIQASYAAGQAGDLLLLCQPGTQPVEPDAVPELERVYRTVRPMRSLNDARIQTACTSADLSMLVVRDSFGEGLFPYLANTAGNLVFSRSDKDVPGQARAADARWIVVEIAQRNLRDWLENGALIP